MERYPSKLSLLFEFEFEPMKRVDHLHTNDQWDDLCTVFLHDLCLICLWGKV
jgi:hypothetical protein